MMMSDRVEREEGLCLLTCDCSVQVSLAWFLNTFRTSSVTFRNYDPSSL